MQHIFAQFLHMLLVSKQKFPWFSQLTVILSPHPSTMAGEQFCVSSYETLLTTILGCLSIKIICDILYYAMQLP